MPEAVLCICSVKNACRILYIEQKKSYENTRTISMLVYRRSAEQR